MFKVPRGGPTSIALALVSDCNGEARGVSDVGTAANDSRVSFDNRISSRIARLIRIRYVCDRLKKRAVREEQIYKYQR